MLSPSSCRVRWTLAFLLGATPIVVGAGCLDFKQETVVLRFEDDPNKLTCLLVYEGLNGAPRQGEKEVDSLEQVKTQLASFLANQDQFCLFDNWIGHIDLSPNPKDEAKVAARKRKIARLIEIRNRAFLLNERGELCGYQTITIPDVRKLEDGLNELISEVIDEGINATLSKPTEERSKGFSEESLRISQAAARKGHRWVRISRGKVDLDFPMTRADAEKTIDPSESGINMTYLKTAIPGFAMTAGDGGLSVTMGDGKGSVLTIRSPRDEEKGQRFEKELREHILTLRDVDFDTSQTTKALIESFSSGR
jgi:hypothetical protein